MLVLFFTQTKGPKDRDVEPYPTIDQFQNDELQGPWSIAVSGSLNRW